MQQQARLKSLFFFEPTLFYTYVVFNHYTSFQPTEIRQQFWKLGIVFH